MSVRYLQIEPTTRCNFTCGFCCGRHMDQSDLSFERFLEIVDGLPDLRHVELQGEGEPLMHPRFFDMIAHLRSKNIRVSFITNGSLISPDVAASIVAAGVEKVAVSIESPDPDTFKKLRGGKLEKVLQGMRNLLVARAAAGVERPAVGLAVTVLQMTADSRKQIYALYDAQGLDGGITFQALQNMPEYSSHYDETLAGQTLDRDQAEDLWFAVKRDKELKAIDARKKPVPGFYGELMAGWVSGSRRCPWLESGVYVNRHGAQSACCMMKTTDYDREAMKAELLAGKTPAPCQGCDIARSVLSTKTERVVSRAKTVARWAKRLPVLA